MIIKVEKIYNPENTDFIFPMMRANALYEGQYLLGTSIARPLIAKAHVANNSISTTNKLCIQ